MLFKKEHYDKTFVIGAIAIMIAAIAWSLDGTLIRPNFYEIPAINIVFLEHFFGALLLSPFLVWWWKRIKNMSRKSMLSVVWVSFFGWLLGTLMITEAYFAAFRGETTISTVVILQKLQPIFALGMAAILLKEKLSKHFYMWAWLAIISGYMIAFGSYWKEILNLNFSNNAAFYAFLAAFAFGSSTVFWKNLVSDLGFRVSSALRFSTTTVFAFIFLLIFGELSSFKLLEAVHWQLLVLIVFTSWAAALSLYYYWLRKVSASSATIFELMWPLSAIFFDWYFNDNLLNPTQIIFSIILIFCFFMIIREQKSKE